jgi:hypothetical protein
MEPIPHARGRYSHAESMFDATRSGIDDAYAFAGNAVRHSPAGAGGQFAVQIAALPGHWKLRIDDDRGSVEGPQLLLGERGDPLHGLVALNRAGVQWTLPGPGAILAEINCPLPDEIPADLSVPAKRAVASVR